LTRSMMIFGQGVMRAHPFLLAESEALAASGGEARFDALLRRHALRFASNFSRAALLGISHAIWARAPASGSERRYFQHLGRFSAAFAALTDIALLTLGGNLKRNEAISGRFADALAYQYLCAATLKSFNDHGSPRNQRPALDWACQYALHQVEEALLAIVRNLPLPGLVRGLLRLKLFPWGRRSPLPSDHLNRQLSAAVQRDDALLGALTAGIALIDDAADTIGVLDAALSAQRAAQPITTTLAQQGHRYRPVDGDYRAWVETLLVQNRIDAAQAQLLHEAAALTQKAIAVDAFPIRGR